MLVCSAAARIATAADGGVPTVASGFAVSKYPTPQPACTGAALTDSLYFNRLDCGFVEAAVDGAGASSNVEAEFLNANGDVLGTSDGAFSEGEPWQFPITPEGDWDAGPVTIRVLVDGAEAVGEGKFFLNQLGGEIEPVTDPDGYRPGDAIPVEGEIHELHSVATTTQKAGVAAEFGLRTVDHDGNVLWTSPSPFTAASDGAVSVTLPPEATSAVAPDRTTSFRQSVRIELVDASFADPNPLNGGDWGADAEPVGSAVVSVTPDEPVLENSFVSSVGWVKPGESYPFTLRVKNYDDAPKTGVEVALTAPDSTTITDAGAATPTATGLDWALGTIPAADADGPGVATIVAEARADTLVQDPRIVWKDLSTRAVLTYDGGPADGIAEPSRGPKVIPPQGDYETARYGDRPFPVVPVDFTDRSHDAGSSSSKLATTINDPTEPGSTFNLYQEMSYGQLFPRGTVPSDGIASEDWSYGPGFDFSQNTLDPDTCRGFTNANLGDTYQQLDDRISDGWYQLPGSTDYYGDDSSGSALIGALTGVGALQDIDSACGPTGKAVYDAAQIADPEIDYSDYDTDKDGVVDFFMMIFPGLGGNGDSQLNGVPPYDNIWPHSADLRNSYTDPATGLTGYVSDDQLRDLEGNPLWYTDSSRTQMTTTPGPDELKVFVRVGPYNVNPETAIDKASVISHEYGHSLGLPDYYTTGNRGTYGSWSLMATDYSQNIDVVGKEELGWVIPRVLGKGETAVRGWQDTKLNTHRIDWREPDGDPYTLSGAADNVNNGEAYEAPLPGRRIIDPAIVPSGQRLWWSRSGNDFGCTPEAGRNLDIALPGLADVPAGTPVTLTMKSRWDIEWDYDYGYVLASTDDGQSYRSYPSQNGFTTGAATNPNQSACQSKYGNGITGSSGSFQGGTQATDRLLGNYPEAPFVDDSYDLSDLAGQASTVRLSYATDPGLARPGWFIDDLKVTAGDRVLYDSDFEDANDPAIFNGGCRDGLQTAPTCTDGWQYVTAGEGAPAEHAYLMEMRDRSGFDADGRGESDRGPIGFAPGMLLTYTDENHGYGNVGTDDPPAQSPLDSQPAPEDEDPNLDDAAFTAAAGDSGFTDSGAGHVDNYTDPSRPDGLWRFDFGCLSFDVANMSGQGVGPVTLPLTYDLSADVDFDVGEGCGSFDYGNSATPRDAGDGSPTAVAQARPTEVAVGEEVSFDGSGSFDDLDAPEDLTYDWDLDGDGSFESQGREVRHMYGAPGDVVATLRVTDSAGHSDTDTVSIVVKGATSGGPGGGGQGGGPVGEPAKQRCGGLRVTILGAAGPQRLVGTKGRDVIKALGGDDTVRGRGGRDVICGDGGADRLDGGPGNDRVKGGRGKDRCRPEPSAGKLRSCEL